MKELEDLTSKCAGKAYRQFIAGTESENLISFEDLKHAGVIGYLDGSRRFDKNKGSNKRLFVGMRVRGAIIDWLRGQSFVHIPQKKYAQVKDLREARQLMQQMGEDTSPERVASFLGWAIEDVHRVEALQPKVNSLDQTLSSDGEDSNSLHDILPGKAKQPLDTVLEKEIAKLIDLCLENLPSDDDRLLLHARMREDKKLKHLALLFDCTAQAVHQRQKKALERMKKCLESNGWKYEIHSDK